MGRLLLALMLAGCAGSEVAAPEPGVWSDAELAMLATLRLDPTPRPDPSNRWADDDAAAALGQALYYDAGMSPTGTVSCATCHEPAQGFGDGKPRSQGVGTTERHAPVIPGSQYGAWFFWDGRADSLWAQAAGPVESPAEMGSDRTFVARYVTTQHKAAYEAIFGPAPELSDADRFPAHARPTADASDPQGVAWAAMSDADRATVTRTFTNALKAIAAYERRLVLTDAPFDRYVDALRSGDASGGGHLDEAQVRGLSLFLRQGNCTSCHLGPALTDRAFHNLGLPFAGGFDAGRSVGAAQVLEHELNCASEWSDAEACPELDYLDPSFPDFQQAFKTPTLRNVARTAPYMHHGELPDLMAVVTFYSDLPGDAAANHRELTLQPLHLDEGQKTDLIAFLTALTGDPLPESLLRPPAPPAAATPGDDTD